MCTDGHENLHKLAIVFFTLSTHGSLETKVSMPEIGNRHLIMNGTGQIHPAGDVRHILHEPGMVLP